MQLPPTVLSLDKRKKKGSAKGSGLAIKGSTEKTKMPGKAATKSPENSKRQETPSETPQDEGQSCSDTGTDSDSDSDLVKGDTVIAEEDVSPPAGDAEPKPKRLGIPDKRPVLRPPRTLETTLFDRLEKMYGPGIKRLLNVQYRYVVRNFRDC